jgi:peptidoglycan/LPS O-acetylase OafA/YrhL
MMKGSGALTCQDSQGHIASLDGVRGVAISLVLMVHLLWVNPATGLRLVDLISKIRAAGWVGVDLFFALSGFLITGILFDTLQSNHYFRNFYARRILRIFPLYYGVVFILFLVLHPATFAEGRPFYRLFLYIQNTMLWWNGANLRAVELTNHLWSLAVEEQFYLVWPIVIFLVRDRRRLLWVAVLLAAAAFGTRAYLLAHGANFGVTYTLTICRADSLLSGACLALAVRGERKSTVLRLAGPAFAIAVLICGVIAWRAGGFDWEESAAVNLYGYSIIAIGSTAFIAMSLRSYSLTAKAMNLIFLRFLGKYSYGIYIFQHILAVCADLTLVPFLASHTRSRFLIRILTIVTVLSATIGLAWLSYHFYERRFLNLKRYFNESPSRSHPEVATVVSSAG